MQIKQTGMMYGIIFGVLTTGYTMTSVCQEITLHNFNRVSNLKPIAHTEMVQSAPVKQTTLAKKPVMHQRKSKVKVAKPATVNSTVVPKKHDHIAFASPAKKTSSPKNQEPAVLQNPQPIAPVANAIWAESKDVAPVAKTESSFSSTATHLALAVLAAFVGTFGVLGFIFVRSKEKKSLRFDVYNQRNMPIQKKDPVVAVAKKPDVIQEPKRRELSFAPAFEIEQVEQDERTVRNEYELSRALQDLKSKQRIHGVVAAKKNVKSKKNRIGNAKKIGTGIGEFELATQLAKMQGRSTSKVMS